MPTSVLHLSFSPYKINLWFSAIEHTIKFIAQLDKYLHIVLIRRVFMVIESFPDQSSRVTSAVVDEGQGAWKSNE
jgi:hypothetical protein